MIDNLKSFKRQFQLTFQYTLRAKMGEELMQNINLRQLLLGKTEWFKNQFLFQKGSNINDYYPTTAQSKVLSLIQEKSFRISDLARQIRISRQAIHKTVNDLVKVGIVKLSPDPTNKNAKLVSMTEEGADKIKELMEKERHIEQDLAKKIGVDKVQVLYEILGHKWGDAESRAKKAQDVMKHVSVVLPKQTCELLDKLQANTGEGISKIINNSIIGFSKQISDYKNTGKQVDGEWDKIRSQLKKVKEKLMGDEERIFNQRALDAMDSRTNAFEGPADDEKDRYHGILEYSSDVIYLANLNTNKFEYVSPSSKREWHLTPEELLSKYTPSRVTDSIYPEDREKLNRFIEDSISGAGKESGLFEFRSKVEKGKGYRWLSHRHRIVFDENNQAIAIVGNVRDITERKQAEKKLMELVDELEVKVKESSVSLEETNSALRVLLKQNQKEKEEIEDRVLFNVKELIMPFIEKLKHSRLKDMEKYIGILESNLNQITSSFSSRLTSKHLNLTHQEIQVSNHILHGKTTKEIAELMGLSTKTIDFHRAKIRKKMGLTNIKESLRTRLLSLQ